MARAIGINSTLAVGFETVYGTPPAASKYWRVPFARSSLGSDQPLLGSELLGFGRDPQAPIKDAISVDGDVTVPMDPRYMGIWLRAAFGGPTTSGITPNKNHVFQSGAATLPSFTVEQGMPEVPYFALISGCVVDGISFTMSRSGLITASVSVVAQGETIGTTTTPTAPVTYADARFGAFQGAIERAGVALGNVTSASVNYSNGLERVETIRADGKIDGVDPTQATLTGEITVRFADQMLLNQAVAGGPAEFKFSYAIPGGPSLTFVAHAVYLPKAKIGLEGPGGVSASFAWQAARAVSPARMCTVTLINDVNDYTL